MADGTQVEWQRREPPPLFKFVNKGDVLEGLLIGRATVEVQGKPVMKYTVKKAGGAVVVFLGSADIVSKLRVDDLGHMIRVAYIGEDQMVKRGDNFMRVFEVDVSARPMVRKEESLEITDEDIPF